MREVKVCFTGDSFEKSLGNGLFQVLFYTFPTLRLICVKPLSPGDIRAIEKHAELHGCTVRFHFINKSLTLTKLARRCGSLGRKLFSPLFAAVLLLQRAWSLGISFTSRIVAKLTKAGNLAALFVLRTCEIIDSWLNFNEESLKLTKLARRCGSLGRKLFSPLFTAVLLLQLARSLGISFTSRIVATLTMAGDLAALFVLRTCEIIDSWYSDKTKFEDVVFISPMDFLLWSSKVNFEVCTVVVADLLMLDFPDQFERQETRLFLNELRSKLKAPAVNKVVTFSHHVADSHLVEQSILEKDRIAVIPHALHDLSTVLGSDLFGLNFDRANATKIIRESDAFSEFEKNKICYGKFLLSVSTLRKPYKGSATFRHASKWLANTELFLVATSIGDFDQDLFQAYGHVTPRHRVGSEELSALYFLSLASVHFSLFEGGVNVAPFSEGVSVGTPCIFQNSKAICEAGLASFAMGMFDASENNFATFESQVSSLLEIGPSALFQKQRHYYEIFSKQWPTSEVYKGWASALGMEN